MNMPQLHIFLLLISFLLSSFATSTYCSHNLSYAPQECVLCEQIYPLAQLVEHTLECLKNQPQKKQEYPCASCLKLFKTRRSALLCEYKHPEKKGLITQYIKENDQEREIKRWYCELCNQGGFQELGKIRDHLMSHSSDPAKCPFLQCKKSVQTGSLPRHIIQQHTPFRRFKCSYSDCNYTGHPESIFSHVLTHVQEEQQKASSLPIFIPVPREEQVIIEPNLTPATQSNPEPR